MVKINSLPMVNEQAIFIILDDLYLLCRLIMVRVLPLSGFDS